MLCIYESLLIISTFPNVDPKSWFPNWFKFVISSMKLMIFDSSQSNRSHNGADSKETLMTFQWLWWLMIELLRMESEHRKKRKTILSSLNTATSSMNYHIFFFSCSIIILSKLNDGRNKFHITHWKSLFFFLHKGVFPNSKNVS